MDKTARTAVPLDEAARRLGKSVQATRKRLQRGSLAGYTLDGRWMVYVDAIDEALAQAATPQPRPARPAQPARDDVQAILDRLDALQAEVATVRGILEAERAARVPALPAPVTEPAKLEDTMPATVDTPPVQPSRWQRFVRWWTGVSVVD